MNHTCATCGLTKNEEVEKSIYPLCIYLIFTRNVILCGSNGNRCATDIYFRRSSFQKPYRQHAVYFRLADKECESRPLAVETSIVVESSTPSSRKVVTRELALSVDVLLCNKRFIKCTAYQQFGDINRFL